MLTNEVRESYAFGIYEMTKSLGHRRSVDLATISDEDLIKEHAAANQAVTDSIARDRFEGQSSIERFEQKLAKDAYAAQISEPAMLAKLIAEDETYSHDLGYFCYIHGLPYEYEPKLREMMGK